MSRGLFSTRNLFERFFRSCLVGEPAPSIVWSGRENPAVPTSEYSLNSPNQLAPFQISNGVSSVSHSFSTLPPSAPAILCSAHTLPTCSEPDPGGQTRRPPWKRGWLGGNEPKIRLAQVALVKAVSGNESSCDSKHAA